MNHPTTLRSTINTSLIVGVVTLSICMIGLVEAVSERYVITDYLTLGQLLLFGGAPVAGYLVLANNQSIGMAAKLIYGIIAGFVSAIPPFLLILLSLVWQEIRDAFINVSPTLLELMTFSAENRITGGLMLVGILTALGIVGSLFYLLAPSIRRATLIGFGWAVGFGSMSDILVNILRPRMSSTTMRSLFGTTGLQLIPFLVIGILIALFAFWWKRQGSQQYAQLQQSLTPAQKRWSGRTGSLLLFCFLLILPSLLGIYLSEIFNNVGLYILMGLGLNIAVGLAGLLDLGYVTNFAVGAYLMALLTSSSEYGLESPVSFWFALPICVAAAMLAGFIFALPVLKMRGDYLAIATLGFGEIVRILARSDALKSVIGGAQGILQIPQAHIGGFLGDLFWNIVTPINTQLSRFSLGILNADGGEVHFGTPPQLYYLVLAACILMLFISRQLNNSRVGRRWMAIREDEDVAAAMGINTTNAKVVAFTLSAASGGLAGAIFAAKLGSIFPHSFQLLISVNVLSLIIVGGIGSIPGVVVGAFALIGVPELLREFAEFRLLFYGIALIVMMLVRPEGLWPSDVRRRELRSEENPEAVQAAT